MFSIFVFIFLFLNFLSFGISNRNKDFGDLCFLTIVVCHGEHAPDCSYPKDTYKDPCHWPNGLGQLTKLGKQQQYSLGKWLRQNYVELFDCRYNRSDIHVLSEDSDPSLTSAYCCMAGFFKGNSENIDGFPLAPVPVHTIPGETDNLLGGCKPCPLYDSLLREAFRSGEVCLADDYYDEVFMNLSKKTGLKINSVKDCEELYKILTIQQTHGLKLPEWTHAYYPNPLVDIAELSYKLPCSTVPLKRLKCGPLVKHIMERIDNKISAKETQKMVMYMGNDKTLVNLMQCLNVYDGCIPAHSSMILFELYKAESNYYLSISFKSPGTFKTLRSPTCGRICSLQVFKSTVRPIIPDNWEAECNKAAKFEED